MSPFCSPVYGIYFKDELSHEIIEASRQRWMNANKPAERLPKVGAGIQIEKQKQSTEI